MIKGKRIVKQEARTPVAAQLPVPSPAIHRVVSLNI